MNRAFVKEPDEGAPAERLPDRQISDHPNYVTPAGLKQLEQKVGELETQRVELLDDEDALSGDQLAYVDRDLRYFTARLESAIPVDLGGQPRRKVAFGAAVGVSENGGKKRTFAIVGEDEADLASGRISYVSPLAEALLEARVGATVLWRRPAGDIELTVESIDYPEQ